MSEADRTPAAAPPERPPERDPVARGAAGEMLKDSPLRRVVRVFGNEDGRAFVVKSYRARGPLDRIRSLVRGSGAHIEAANLERARAASLPCPEPLRCARDGRESTLLLEDLGPGRALDRAIPGLAREAATDLLARAGALIADAFVVGLEHRDLHLGNVFVTDDDRLFLLDLHAARFRDGPARPAPRCLRGLYLSLPWPEQRPLREALLRPLGAPADPPWLPRRLRRHLDRRLGRCVRDSGSFVRGQQDGAPFLARRGFPGEPRAWRRSLEDGAILKSGRRGRVVRTSDGIAKVRGPAAAAGLWRAAEALALRGIPHPPALAWFRAGGERWCVLSARSDARPLAELAAAGARERRAVAADLAASLARLHATGWRCRDTRGDNLGFAGGRAVLLDLDGVRPAPRWRWHAVRAADLGRLLAWLRYQAPEPVRDSRVAPALRFLVHYVRACRALGLATDARSLARAVGLRCERWRRRHR